MAISPPNEHIFNRIDLLFFYLANLRIEHSIILLIIILGFSLDLVDSFFILDFLVEGGSRGFRDGFEFNVSVGLKRMLFNFSFFESHHF